MSVNHVCVVCNEPFTEEKPEFCKRVHYLCYYRAYRAERKRQLMRSYGKVIEGTFFRISAEMRRGIHVAR